MTIKERLARGARRLRARLRDGPPVWFHPDYAAPPGGPMDPERGAKILRYLLAEGCVDPRNIQGPPIASIETLSLVHEAGYLDRVGDDPAISTAVFAEALPTETLRAVIRQQRRMVAGTVAAARTALKTGGPALHLGGGLHHAHPDRGGGFCLFNDTAVAIRALRADGFAGRVLVVDLDMHPGDGTRAAFAADESVFTFSLHAAEWEAPETVAACLADRSVELGPGIGDRAYLAALDEHLPQVFRLAEPDLVVYVAGVDVADDDTLGNWHLDHDTIAERDRRVLQASADLPLVWVTAGGYGSEAWRHSARGMARLACGLDRPIPSGMALGLDRFRSVARRLTAWELTGEPPADGDDLFQLTWEDLGGALGGGSAGVDRFLGYYSRFGIEVALERYGILKALARLGYPDVRLELDLSDPVGHRVRCLSADERAHLLIELVVREHRGHPPFRLLFIEWLLMQNPSAPAERPLLPGQSHPGLGLVDEILGMLTMSCERLGFDGLGFHPSGYHIAAMARRAAVFLDPELEGRFSSMSSVLEALPLHRAAHEIEQGRLLDDATGEPVPWPAELMTVPVSEALREHLAGKEYEQAVRLAAARRRFRLAPADTANPR